MFKHILCPVCKKQLKKEQAVYRCNSGHSFDLSAQGYLHLLLSQKMHSKLPGDNPEMTQARQLFLQKGYYHALLERLCQIAAQSLHRQEVLSPVVIDGGCGEGYYTDGLAVFLQADGFSPTVYGFDISKSAIKKAAKKNKQILFSVASLFDLPVASECGNLFISIFAPLCEQEFARVLTGGGSLLVVGAGPDHLFELKELLYEQPYRNEEKKLTFPGFVLKEKYVVKDRFFLPTREDVKNLFMMTPYYYNTPFASHEKLNNVEGMHITADFEIFEFVKI
jgi:23S rRNA (guanine745-N1)-methyltransferase